MKKETTNNTRRYCNHSYIHGDVTARSAPISCGQSDGYVMVTVISVELG